MIEKMKEITIREYLYEAYRYKRMLENNRLTELEYKAVMSLWSRAFNKSYDYFKKYDESMKAFMTSL